MDSVSDLSGSQSHLGVLHLAELCELIQNGSQLICQSGIPATKLVLHTGKDVQHFTS